MGSISLPTVSSIYSYFYNLVLSDIKNDQRFKIKLIRSFLTVHIFLRYIIEIFIFPKNFLNLPIKYFIILHAFLTILYLYKQFTNHHSTWPLVLITCLHFILFVIYRLPVTSNHSFIESLLLILFIANDLNVKKSNFDTVFTLRVITLSIFFFSGIKKLYYGQYFTAHFFAYLFLDKEYLRSYFAYLLSQTDYTALQKIAGGMAINTLRLKNSYPLFVASNLTWISQIIIPIGALIPKLRTISLAIIIGEIIIIEFFIRELMFGFLFIALTLFFLEIPKKWMISLYAILITGELIIAFDSIFDFLPFVYTL